LDHSLEQNLRIALREQLKDAGAALDAGASRLGWKAGFGTAAAMQKLGTEGPLVGFMTDSTLAPAGTAFDVSGWRKPVLEAEVAVRLAADLPAGTGTGDIEAAVDAVGAAIELVDLGGATDDAAAILAANVFHRAVLLGELIERPAGDSLDSVRIDVLPAGGPEVLGADPAQVLGELTGVLAGLAELLESSPDGLRAGDIIITGAAVKPFELTGGELVEVRVGSSAVSARIE